MPEALATTKRKFHKLLDSRFGTTPPAPAANNPVNVKPLTTTSQNTMAEPAAKRIRSGDTSASILASIHKRNASTKSLASIRTVGSTRTVNTPQQPTREPPNFAPWSHDTFLARMRTFSRVTQWHPKPEAVNEVEWAKRGWSCVDTNTVCCKGGCGQRLLVNVEPVVRRRHVPGEHKDGTDDGQDVTDNTSDAGSEDDEGDSEELENALVERYKDLIIDGHAEGCLWRQVGCKPDIYRLPIVKSSVWQPTVRDHYLSLLKISESLQSVHLKPNDTKPSPEKLLAHFPPTLLAPPESTASTSDNDNDDSSPPESATRPTSQPQAQPKALLAALTGWRGATESGTELLVCDACFQRIGLWMYQPDYKRSRKPISSLPSDEATAAAEAKVEDDEDVEEEQDDHALDLVDLHREHCPWRNEVTQAATGDYAGLPAWRILLRVLERYADEWRRRSGGLALTPAPASAPEVVRAASEAEGSVVAPGGRDDEEVDGADDDDGRLALMPELTREETEKLDKERSSKLKKLKKVFGFTKRASVSAPSASLI